VRISTRGWVSSSRVWGSYQNALLDIDDAETLCALPFLSLSSCKATLVDITMPAKRKNSGATVGDSNPEHMDERRASAKSYPRRRAAVAVRFPDYILLREQFFADYVYSVKSAVYGRPAAMQLNHHAVSALE